MGGRAAWTQEIFEEKCRECYGDYYDYSEAVYTKSCNSVDVICPKHGKFSVNASSHAKGHGCQRCGWDSIGDKLRGSLSEFVERAQDKYSEFGYDYSQVEYKTARTKVKIVCPKHGEFYRTPDIFLGPKSLACPECPHIDHTKRQKIKKEKFIVRARKVHGNSYDYEKVDYKGNSGKIEIFCKKHGSFTTSPITHMKPTGGCDGCRREIREERLKVEGKQTFLQRAKEVHKESYSYEKAGYVNRNTKIIITCPEHGDFLQEPTKHLLGRGCPRCADKIRYIYQYHCHKQNDMYYTDARSNIYVMRFTMPNDGDTFIKIGLSVNVEERRYKLALSSGADVEVLYQMEDRADHLRLCEHSTFDLFKYYEYSPVEKFDGHSECFREELYEDLVEYIEKYMYDAALFESKLPTLSEFDIKIQKESQNDHSSAA